MSVEKIILLAAWIVSLGLLLLVPKEKKCLSQLAFLFKQTITWIFGLIVVEYRLLEYPVRFFASVNRTSFTFEFMTYPAICGFFNAYFPIMRGRLYRAGYYILYCSILTLIEDLLERHTDLIRYIHWDWYWTWITLWITFFISRQFCVWFLHLERVAVKK